MLKSIFGLAIVAGLAALSAEAQDLGGCDGPQLVTGYDLGTCDCVSNTPGGPTGGGTGSCQQSGPSSYVNDYYICGGEGFTYCYTESETVGYSYSGCVDTPNYSSLSQLIDAAVDCARLNNGWPPISCNFSWCAWNSCAMPTSGGTPITEHVEYELGDANGCVLAKFQKSSSPSLPKLAMVTRNKISS
jgi:hypothetical protein